MESNVQCFVLFASYVSIVFLDAMHEVSDQLAHSDDKTYGLGPFIERFCSDFAKQKNTNVSAQTNAMELVAYDFTGEMTHTESNSIQQTMENCEWEETIPIQSSIYTLDIMSAK